jgi:hypothetical protein
MDPGGCFPVSQGVTTTPGIVIPVTNIVPPAPNIVISTFSFVI